MLKEEINYKCCGNHHEHREHTHQHQAKHEDCHDGCCSHNHTHEEESCSCDHSITGLSEEKKKDKIPLSVYMEFLSVGLMLINIFFIKEKSLSTYIYLLSYFFAGYDVLYMALKNILKGNVFSEHFLMSVATVGAIFLGDYLEAIAVMLFYKIGEELSEMAARKSVRSVESLLKLKEEKVLIKKGAEYIQVDSKAVGIGDIMLLKPSMRLALDGAIKEGETFLDTSAITGESVPRKAKIGDEVYAGSIVMDNPILVTVTKEYENSTIAKMIYMVKEATEKKSQTEKFITKFSKIYTPIVVFSALALATIPTLIFNLPFHIWLNRALVFLVVSCPCALVLSLPLGYFAGLGAAAKKGILIKGSNYIDFLANLKAVAFDKTGTLTKGEFKVYDIKGINQKEETVLQLAAKAEYYSTHPIAKAIVEKYNDKIDTSSLSNYELIEGMGVKVQDGKDVIFVGNANILNNKEREYEQNNQNAIYVKQNDLLVGYLVIGDSLKDDTKEALINLKKLNVNRLIMLTGDSKENAEKIAQEIGITEVHAEMLPEDKVNEYKKISKKEPTAFVGDGINDAPVLASADIGISMGALGSDAAMEAADVVIIDDNLLKIPSAIFIARFTTKLIKQNLVFILGVKIFVLLLGAFGYASMWGAVFADVGTSLIATLNATRALKAK